MNIDYSDLIAKLERLHTALDKVPLLFYPHKSGDRLIVLILAEIIKLHTILEESNLDQLDIVAWEQVESAVLRIIKKTIDSASKVPHDENYKKFSNFTRLCLNNADSLAAAISPIGDFHWLHYGDGSKIARHYDDSTDDASGLHLEWYPDGSIKKIGQYVKGHRAGLWMEFDNNGNVVTKNEFTLKMKHNAAELSYKEQLKAKVKNHERQPTSDDNDDIGLGKLIIGSMAVAGFGALLKKMYNNKKSHNIADAVIENTAEVKEHVQKSTP